MEIRIHETKSQLNIEFTKWFKNILKKSGSINVALSGGSTPKALFDYWANLPKGEIDWSKVKFFWGDERCVPPADEESNYRMTKEHLLDHIDIPENNIFRIKGENPPSEEQNRYANILCSEVEQSGGVPSFDIMILGMGDDGHTASIFPYQRNLWFSPQLCVEATHPDSGQRRISLTGKVINSSKNVAFLVTGKNKAGKVKEIIEMPDKSAKIYPAALVKPKDGDLIWFLDNEAAELINNN